MNTAGSQLIIAAIVGLPFMSFLACVFLGRRLKENAQYVSILAVTISLVFSVFALLWVAGVLPASGGQISFSVPWIGLGEDATFPMGVQIGHWTAVMLVIVCFVSLMVQLFSGGYMAGHPRFAWYYAVVSIFTGSMLGLVVSPNFIQAYFFWELVGGTSYLIHGFYFERPAATYAAQKAFIVNRVADAALFIGIMVFWRETGTTSFSGIAEAAKAGIIGQTALTIGLLLVLLGATGKSAQFPLHVWLSNAMQGPTPLSALIHAAAMIVTGVYVISRTYDIFVQSPTAMEVVAIVGAFTAFMAATMALVQKDIKQIIAYSTISQFGYVMLGLGVGAFTAGVFHIYTHALFKSLLFLLAANLGYAVAGSSDMRVMGGLKSRMPVTYWAFVIAGLALAGVFPFSGFWSKDAVIASAYEGGHYVLFALALLTVGLTAFYIFRGIFICFHGEPRSEDARKASEVPVIMRVPVVILAFLSVVAGWVGIPKGFGLPVKDVFGDFVRPDRFVQSMTHTNPGLFSFVLAGISVLFALVGLWLAYVFVLARPQWAEALGRRLPVVHDFLLNGWYFDLCYDRLFVRPAKALGRAVRDFDLREVGGLVSGFGRGAGWAGEKLRSLQTGGAQNYALFILFGAFAVAVLASAQYSFIAVIVLVAFGLAAAAVGSRL